MNPKRNGRTRVKQPKHEVRTQQPGHIPGEQNNQTRKTKHGKPNTERMSGATPLPTLTAEVNYVNHILDILDQPDENKELKNLCAKSHYIE